MLYLKGSHRVGEGSALQQIPCQQLRPCFVPLESGLCIWGNVFYYLFIYLSIYLFTFSLISRCRIVLHLKAVTLNPSEGLWASPLLSVFVTGASCALPLGWGGTGDKRVLTP